MSLVDVDKPTTAYYNHPDNLPKLRGQFYKQFELIVLLDSDLKRAEDKVRIVGVSSECDGIQRSNKLGTIVTALEDHSEG